MDEDLDRRIWQVVEATQVVREPRQHLATFGVTRVTYYVVTEPAYAEVLPGAGAESVVRRGLVVSERPTIVTPTYMLNLEGFSEGARRYFEHVARTRGPNSPGILYRYRNEQSGMDIVGGEPEEVARRIADDLERRRQDLSAVVLGVDEMWDVSLLKFIYEYTARSLASNVGEMQAMGLLNPHPQTRVPMGVIRRIEEMFRQVEEGLDPRVLKEELDRWGLWEHYEARFLRLFRRRR